jgi:serine/threonine-protein kinase HipA
MVVKSHLSLAGAAKYDPPEDPCFHQMFRLLREISANPIEDMLRLWDELIFDYLIGNTDNHLKNYSILYDQNLRGIRLAPAYDLISTIVYEHSATDFAIGINGKFDMDEITRADFAAAAPEAGIGTGIAMRHFDQLAGNFTAALDAATQELSLQGFSDAERLHDIIMRALVIR